MRKADEILERSGEIHAGFVASGEDLREINRRLANLETEIASLLRENAERRAHRPV